MQENRTLRAAAWMIGSTLSFSAMAIAGREMAGILDTYDIMLYRSLIGLAAVAAYAHASGQAHLITLRRLPMHMLRNGVHFAGQNLWFFAVGVAPLTQVFALEFTQPVWALIVSVLILRERLTLMQGLATVAGFLGILVITRPWIAGMGPGIPEATLAAVSFAVAAVVTRLLTRTEPVLSIVFWMPAMQAVMALACTGWDGAIALPPPDSLHWVLVIGLSGILAHLCLTMALALAPAAVVLPIDFARLPLISVLAFLIYGESVGPAVWFGAALILAANYANLVAESRATPAIRATAADP